MFTLKRFLYGACLCSNLAVYPWLDGSQPKKQLESAQPKDLLAKPNSTDRIMPIVS